MLQFSRFNDFLLKYTHFTVEELKTFNDMCSIKAFKKGVLIINVDQKNSALYFMIKGIVKYFITNQEGVEVIYNFRMEHMTITSYSFYNNNIAKFNVECLEDCEAISIPIEAIGYVVTNFKNGALLRGYLAEAHIIELVNLLTDKDSKSIIDRYNNIEVQFPDINQRVPQHLIANFLGVSQEHLSRLKKSRIDKNP